MIMYHFDCQKPKIDWNWSCLCHSKCISCVSSFFAKKWGNIVPWQRFFELTIVVTVKMTMKQHMLVHKLVTIADNKCSSEGMLLAGYMKFLSVKSDHCFIYLFIISWKVADPRMARWPPGWKPGPGATWPGKRSLSLDQLVISPNISGWSFK